MKIAVWHNLPSGGGKRALYDHVRGLVQRGHTIESWCPPTADISYLSLREFGKEHIVPLTSQIPKGRSLETRLAIIRGNYPISAMEAHCAQCSEQIDQGGFDILFANSCALYLTPYIGRFVSAPKALYLGEPDRALHEAHPQLLWTTLPSVLPKNKLNRLRVSLKHMIYLQGLAERAREEWRNIRSYDRVLVNSYYSREVALRSLGADSHVCYPGVDTQRFHAQRLPREDFIVGLGSLIGVKNIEFVIEALAKVRPPRPRLIWIGNMSDPTYQKQMTALAAERGICFEPKIYISDEELVSLLNRARMLAYASRLEPLGLAPLEANACGTPVIAAAEAGIRETVQNGINGLLVEPTHSAMAAGIQQLLDHPDYAAQLGRNAERYINETWTLDRSIDRIESHLLDTIAIASSK